MREILFKLLKIKPHETGLVKKLFAVQFLLGVSTAFLFTSSLTSFISIYHTDKLPEVYILSAVFLFVFNPVYSHLDGRLSSAKLLEKVILFAVTSIFVFWASLLLFKANWLTLLLAGWYLLVYMLINYAFWGMASMMFNVRESHRLFSLVGAGDIPSKMLGYLSVTALAPFVGSYNLLLVSVVTGTAAWWLVRKYQKKDFLPAEDNAGGSAPHHATHAVAHPPGRLTRFFGTRIVFFIAVFSFISYLVFAFMDFTFLAGVRTRYSEEAELAFFIGVFFASGRVLAIFFKVLFSSRVIAAIGLANSLLVTPVLLLLITLYLVLSPAGTVSPVYLFGVMVLLSEMLRSTLQEPVFFILFQPLKPHDRLKGHLVAKGHTMPLALLGVGTFLFFYLQRYNDISISFVSRILLVLLVFWCASVFFIKREYLQTLVALLRKGYFTGSRLFLNDEKVTALLVKKVREGCSQEVIHSLNLLEKSGYTEKHILFYQMLKGSDPHVKAYVLDRIIANNMKGALPRIREELRDAPPELVGPLYRAVFYLDTLPPDQLEQQLNNLDPHIKRSALVGLLLHKGTAPGQFAREQVEALGSQPEASDRLLALAVIMEAKAAGFSTLLRRLLDDAHEGVVKRAFETAGAVKDTALLGSITAIAKERGYYGAFKTALLNYGDPAFKDAAFAGEESDERLLSAAITVAGKVTGRHSTRFLLRCMETPGPQLAAVICALWKKKAVLQDDENKKLENCLRHLLVACNIKTTYHLQLSGDPQLYLVQDAIGDEIREDLFSILRLYSFLYDSEKVNRVMELIRSGDRERLYNAIEMLELILPAKYFGPTNAVLEWLHDRENSTSGARAVPGKVQHILEEIFANDARFHSWTRSVACYALLTLAYAPPLLHSLELSPAAPGDHLFHETREYVLSTLKN